MQYEHLTLERLKEVLNYDPETGALTWKVRPTYNSKRRAGDLAGTLKRKQNGRWYRTIAIDHRDYQATQLAFFYFHGRWARGQVGQVNGDAADTSAKNLIEMRTTAEKHDYTTKAGRAQYRKDYWTNNPGLQQEYAFRRFYKLSYAEYAEMHDAQNGLCKLCGRPETETDKRARKTKALSVDHDHVTGDVRGLLCRSCNSGLGHFGDDDDLMEKAVAYVRHYRSIKKEAA